MFPPVLSRLAEWLIYQLLGNSCYKAARKMKNYGFHLIKSQSLKYSQHPQHVSPTPAYPSLSKIQSSLSTNFDTMVCDINGTLFRPHSFFPFFMLVAFEGGSIVRAFFLLLSCLILWAFDDEVQLRIMIFITFCGLRLKDMACVERSVLPKFYLEELNYHVYEVLVRARSKVVFTNLPKVMVEHFLKEYLNVDHAFGTELRTCGNYFTGLISGTGLLVKHRALKDYFGDKKPDVGIGNTTFTDHLFLSSCQEAYVVNQQGGEGTKMPRDKYPKPLIFHDGRLAFLPTPLASLAMFMWLPLGIVLAVYRLFVGIALPYKLAIFLGTSSGIRIRTKGMFTQETTRKSLFCKANPTPHRGVLYVCTHRTLLDPVMLGVCLAKALTVVTYSLSKTSEIIAPLRTVRLTRDRKIDGEMMQKLLSEGDLVVCPEGTTCREPYLLRFSSLFAELADEIVPVAMNTRVTMFYGTTASGLKCLDSIFFLMNPTPSYYLHSLGKVPREQTCGGGRSCFDVANHLQRKLADALGFECTKLTRRDKYLMLAGNEGKVGQ